jgi:hypothetical protein
MLRTRIHRTWIISTTLLTVPCLAIAQEAAAPATPAAGSRAIPRPDELEPGVNTTLAAPAVPAATAATAAPAAAPAADASAAKPAPARQNAAAAKATARKGPDRLDLDATDIKGNRELPKVLYIVPWKRADLGDVVGKPVNSLLDEVLQPLDRDVFKRENRYYDDLKPGAAGDAKGGAAQGSETKP